MRYFLLSLLIACCFSYCNAPVEAEDQVTSLQQALRAQYAPDSRTDRVVLKQEGNRVTGYTTQRAAFDSLTQALAGTGLHNAVRLLPDTVIGSRTVGIINVSVANLRSRPGHSQELATQALLGTPVQLLDLADGWYLVRTPDRYIAWLEPGALVAMEPGAAQAWRGAARRLYLDPQPGVLREQPDATSPVLTDLVAGDILLATGESRGDYAQFSLPDGSRGWAKASLLGWPAAWDQPTNLDPEDLLATAYRFRGVPYLWGGTSPKGLDCSGFTKTAYYLNGFVIPRDASQQVHAGEAVELTDDYANLLPGDLLFFGRYRDDGSEKITHTGFYLGNGRFLHSGADNGRIAENSLIPGTEDYVEYRQNSLLQARRLTPGTPGVNTVAEAFER